MADRWRDPIDCERARDELELLAVDALGPDETALLHRHLEACPSCQAELAELEGVVGGVLHSSRPATPDASLVDRIVVARRQDVAAATTDAPLLRDVSESSAGSASGRGASRRRRTVGVAIVAAAAALLLGVGAGLLIGRSGGPSTPTALERVGVEQVRSGVITTARGEYGGTAVVTAGGSPVLLITLDDARSGVTYGCQLRLADGTIVDVGSWTPSADGETVWAVAVDPTAVDARQMLLTGATGATIATADLS